MIRNSRNLSISQTVRSAQLVPLPTDIRCSTVVFVETACLTTPSHVTNTGSVANARVLTNDGQCVIFIEHMADDDDGDVCCWQNMNPHRRRCEEYCCCCCYHQGDLPGHFSPRSKFTFLQLFLTRRHSTKLVQSSSLVGTPRGTSVERLLKPPSQLYDARRAESWSQSIVLTLNREVSFVTLAPESSLTL